MIKLERIKQMFVYNSDKEIDIYSSGIFRGGLSSEEVNNYLIARSNKINIKKLRKKYDEIAGVNTCEVVCANGKSIILYFRHDVERFADVLFKKTKSTYWD